MVALEKSSPLVSRACLLRKGEGGISTDTSISEFELQLYDRCRLT